MCKRIGVLHRRATRHTVAKDVNGHFTGLIDDLESRSRLIQNVSSLLPQLSFALCISLFIFNGFPELSHIIDINAILIGQLLHIRLSLGFLLRLSLTLGTDSIATCLCLGILASGLLALLCHITGGLVADVLEIVTVFGTQAQILYQERFFESETRITQVFSVLLRIVVHNLSRGRIAHGQRTLSVLGDELLPIQLLRRRLRLRFRFRLGFWFWLWLRLRRLVFLLASNVGLHRITIRRAWIWRW